MTPSPVDRGIAGLFEEQARRTPDATALITDDSQISYADLNSASNQLAATLEASGVGPETAVAVCLDRSPSLVIAVMATLKSGGVYVPLDPSHPPERLGFIVRDTAAPVLLSESRFLPALTEVRGCQHIDLDDPEPPGDGRPASDPREPIAGERLAFVLYTSGSTGHPKGVMMTHAGFCNLSNVHRSAFDLGSTSRVLFFGSPSHGNAMIELVTALTTGAALCVSRRDAQTPGPDLADVLKRFAVTNLHAPPSSLAALPRTPLPDLRVLTVGGEALTPDLIEYWAADRRFFNAYGTTESNWLAFVELRPEDATGPITIGHPIDGMAAQVVDEDGNPLPTGEAGELQITGIGLARGYLNAPELTAAKFVDIPAGNPVDDSEPGGLVRAYKSGDRARRLSDGRIELLGRTDRQVKVRGFRIELEEVESVLHDHPSVRQVAVVLRDRSTRGLEAHLVADGPARPSVTELREFAGRKLPPPAVPTAFVWEASLPLTASGKVDRQALGARSDDRPGLDVPFAAPTTPTEEALAAIWARSLDLESVGIHDNFFDLGGDSILSAEVCARAELRLRTDVRPAMLYQTPTIRALAASLDVSSIVPTRRSLLARLKSQRTSSIEGRSPLFAVRSEGSGVPFFWLHGHYSNSVIADYLHPEQPVYGLRSQGVDGTRIRHRHVESIAAYYLEYVRAVQAESPYLLGGYSFGGSVAYEMARQITVAGGRVSLLVLLDPGYPGTPPEDRPLRSRLATRVVSSTRLGLGLRVPAHRRQHYVLDINQAALDRYVPQPYDGPVLYFRSNERPDDEIASWRSVISGPLEVVDVDRSHYALREVENVHLWAHPLRHHLDRLSGGPVESANR